MKPIMNEAKEFKQLPAGNHAAYCIKIIDIGQQEVNKFEEPGTKIVPQAIFCFETPHEKMEDGRPFVIYTFGWTVSSHEKSKFFQAINALNGSPVSEKFWGATYMGQENFEKFVGKPCQIEVIEKESKGSVYTNVKGVHPLPKGMDLPEIHNTPVYFDLDKPNAELQATLPQWIQDRIANAANAKAPKDEAPAPSEGDYGKKVPEDGIPF